MNLIVVTQFFEVICINIFEYLFTDNFKNGGLLGLVSMYFITVKLDGQGMLYFHCFVWLYEVFHLSEIYN